MYSKKSLALSLRLPDIAGRECDSLGAVKPCGVLKPLAVLGLRTSPLQTSIPLFRREILEFELKIKTGMPLGEMFDLEKLSETCKKKNRWTFFFSSAPANVPGGVSSHANAQAFF